MPRVQLCADPSVPTEDWVCIDFEILPGRTEPCGWCGVHRLRNVHVLAHPNWPEAVRAGMTCALRMGDAEAYVREKRFKANYPEKARTLLEIEVQLKRELSAEVWKYLDAAYKRLKYAKGALWAEDKAALAEVLEGLRSGRAVEPAIDRFHSWLRQEFAGRGIPKKFGSVGPGC